MKRAFLEPEMEVVTLSMEMRICKVTFLAEVMWGIVQDAIPLLFITIFG